MADPANADALAGIAHEIGADVLPGARCDAAEPGGGQPGDLGRSAHLALRPRVFM